jgi:hypothetical protein
MRRILTIFILLSLLFFSFIQRGKDNYIDKYVATIDKSLMAEKLTPKVLTNMSRLGGFVIFYYSGKQLELIKTTYSGEFGYNSFDFYILNDSLVFVKEHGLFIKEPENPEEQDKYDKYVKSHTDKNGKVNWKKYPFEKDDDNIYYINNNTIVDFKLKSFGKSKEAFEDDIARKNKEIIEHYKSHLEELNE